MERKRLSRKERAKLREMKRNGGKVGELSVHFDVSESTVARVVRERGGFEKKIGRPTKMSPPDRRALIRQIRENPFKPTRELASSLSVGVCTATVRRELKRNAFRNVRIAKIARLTPAALEKRIEFTRSHVTWSKETWDHVIFSDKT